MNLKKITSPYVPTPTPKTFEVTLNTSYPSPKTIEPKLMKVKFI